jgi:hypothetical protein
MIVNLPKLGPVKFRDDLTQEQFLAQVQQLSEKHDFKLPGPDYGLMGSFTKGVSRGATRMGETFGDILPALGASALGFDDYAKAQMAEAKATEEQLARENPAQFESYKQVEGVGDAARYALETLGEVTPDMASMLVPGGIGGAVAKRGAAKLAEKELAGITPGLVETGASAEELAHVAGRVGAENAARQQAKGQGVGVYLGSFAMNTPEVFQSIYQDSGQLAPGASLLFGSVSAALDSVLPATVLRSLSPAGKAAITGKILEQSGMRPGLAKNITKSALSSLGTEGLTEGAQEALNIAAEGFVNENRDMWTDKDFNRIVESSVRGAIAGTPFGAIQGAAKNAQEKAVEQQGIAREEAARQQQIDVAMAERQRQADMVTQAQQAQEQAAAQAAQRSQANLPMDLPGMEPVAGFTQGEVGPAMPTEETAQAEQVAAGQESLFGATGKPTPEALSSVKMAAQQQKQAEAQAKVDQKQALAELAPKQFDIMQNVRMKESNLSPTSPLQQLIAQASDFGPKVKAKQIEAARTEPTSVTSDQTWKDLGVGPTAILRKEGALNNLDITKQEDVDRLHAGLDIYLAQSRLSPKLQESVTKFKAALPPAIVKETAPVVAEKATTEAPLETLQAKEALQAEPIEETWDNFDTGVAFQDMPKYLQEEVVSLHGKNKLTQEEADFYASEAKRNEPEDIVEEAPVEEAVAEEAPISKKEAEAKVAGNNLDDAMEKFETLLKDESATPKQIKAADDKVTAARKIYNKATYLDESEPAVEPAPAPKAAKKPKAKAKKVTQAEVNNSTDMVEAVHAAVEAELTPEELSRVNEHYGTTDSNVALDKFTEDFTDWVFAGAKNAQHKLADLFNKVWLSVKHGMLSVAMLVNLNPANTQIHTVNIPVTTYTIKQTVERPKVDFKNVAVPGYIQQVADNRMRANPNKPIAIVDKQMGLTYVIDANGVLAGKSASLTGKTKGDVRSEAAKKTANVESIAEKDKVTEAGMFDASVKNVPHYGNVITLQIFDNYSIAMHPTYLGAPAEQRQARLESATPEDNRISFGCINVPNEFMQNVVFKVIPKGVKSFPIVVIPESKSIQEFFPTEDFASSETKYITKTAQGTAASTPDKTTPKMAATREELTREQAAANLGAALSAIFETKFNIVPGETPPDILKAITQMIEVLIRDGARSLGETVAAIRKDLGEAAFRRVNKKDIARIYREKSKEREKTRKTANVKQKAQEASSEIGIADTVLDNLPEPKPAIIEGALNAVSTVPDSLRKGALGFMSLPNLVEVFGKTFPTLKNLLTAVEYRGARSIEYREQVSRIVNKGSKLIKAMTPAQVKHFNDLILDISRLKLDPRPKALEKDPTLVNNPLIKQFKALPQALQDYAIELADQYEAYGNKYLDLLINQIPQQNNREYLTLVEKMKAKFEAGRIPFYLPLLRSGEYWVSFTDTNGERVVFARESKRQLDEVVSAIEKAGGTNIQRYTQIAQITHRSAPPTGFMAGVISDLQKAKVNDEVINDIYRSYLDLFPAESLKQQFQTRKGDKGYTSDVVQGFAAVGSRMAHQLANMEYAPDIGNAIKGVKSVYEANPSMANRDIYDNIASQEQFLSNPTAAPWASRLSYFSYLSYITGNVSSAVINLTQLPIVVYSLLGGKYGFGEAASAMSRATKMYFAGGLDNNSEFMPDRTFGTNAKGEYADLYKVAVDRSAIRRGVGYEMTEMRKVSTEDYTGIRSKVEHGLGFLFQNSERFNREVTLIATFDLARKSGMSKEEAIEEAIRVNTSAHSHALTDAGPRFFQQGWGKVMFTFKRFAQAQIYLVGRLAQQAYAGESKEVRDIARKQLTGIFGMAYLFAGVQGMPLYGGATLVASTLNAALGDDDEPFDADESVRTAIGDLGYKGPLNQLLNIDIASRTGFNGMLWRDDKKRLADVGPLIYAIEHMMGPAYSALVTNPSRALDELQKGHNERAIEAVMPSFIRNGMKGIRYATEGALNSKGAPIVEDINAYNLAMQILGFTPATLSEAYARAGSMKQAEKYIGERRGALLDNLYLARTTGDTDGMMDINEKIANFNSIHPEPGIKISQDTINKSYTARENALKDTVDGVRLNPKMRPYLVENFGS